VPLETLKTSNCYRESFDKETLTASMKKNDDQLLRQYKVQNLINIIEDLGERDLL